ncbi:MAG: hypothetical protein HRF43_03510, partial [Phycisphaerae bacterium]
MIMAVALTTLLAIIGSSFVLMARQDRQAVRNLDNALIADAAVNDFVIPKIQDLLAAARVGVDWFIDTNGNGRFDFTDANANGVYDAGIDTPIDVPVDGNGDGVIDVGAIADGRGPAGARRMPYDYPGAEHPWLAPIEPWFTGASYSWRQASLITMPASSGPVQAAINRPTLDADGDGVSDSVLVTLTGFDSTGKRVSVAVRIIDNCGMVNVNTVWQGLSGLSNSPARAPLLVGGVPVAYDVYDSFGELSYQIDLTRLLTRTGVSDPAGDAKSSDAERLKGQTLPTAPTPASYNAAALLYQDVVLRDYGWFGLFPAVASGKQPLAPYGLLDEMELRYRFVVNPATSTPLESAMLTSIGYYDPRYPTGQGAPQGADPLPTRALPYGVTDSVASWYSMVTDDRSPLVTANAQAAVPRADPRHLLTSYSFDGEVRPVQPGNAADAWLDDVNQGGVGKWRKVNVNTVLATWMTANFTDPAQAALARRAVVRLARAVEGAHLASGYSGNDALVRGFQFAANLFDFVDPDNVPTVFQKAWTGLSRDIIGTEQQPFITELFNKTTAAGTSSNAAVEIYNPPYNAPIDLTGWRLKTDAWEVDLGAMLAAGPAGPTYLPGKNYIGSGELIVFAHDVSAVAGAAARKVQVTTTTGGQMAFDPPASPLRLIRPLPTGPADFAVIDQVSTATIAAMQANPDQEYYSWRGLWDGMSNSVLPFDGRNNNTILAPLACARNVFTTDSTSVGTLGSYAKVTSTTDPLYRPAIAIRVDNDPMRPVVDANLPTAVLSPLPANVTAATPARLSPLSPVLWRVRGWYELERLLLVGNPSLADGGSTITDWISVATQGGGQWTLNEGLLRIDLASVFGRELMNRVSLLARTDDGVDNDNGDGDSDVQVNNTAKTVTDPGLETGADDLMECRVPGRINVNTAPESVLKAVFPPLWVYDLVLDTSTNTWKPRMTAGPNPQPVKVPLAPDELDRISTWYAKAIVYLREQNNGFKDLADFVDKLDKFDNPAVSGRPVLYDPALPANKQVPSGNPKVLRFNVLVDIAKGRLDSADPNKNYVWWDANLNQWKTPTPLGYWKNP